MDRAQFTMRARSGLLVGAAAATLAGSAAALQCRSAAVPAVAPGPPGPPADWKSCARKDSVRLQDRMVNGYYEGTPQVVGYSGGTADTVRRILRVITGPHTLLCEPTSIAIGPGGEIYVLNHAPKTLPRPAAPGGGWTTWVTLYDSGARDDAAPRRVLRISTPGLGGGSTIGVNRAGYLYVGSGVEQSLGAGSVAVFEAGADGNADPIRVIAGPRTGLQRPNGIAIDRRGDLYVTNETGHSNEDIVRIFAAASSGDIEPCRVIMGERTGLNLPVGLAVDRKDRLYVANAGARGGRANAVTVYDAGAKGDAAPIRTLSGEHIYDGMHTPRRVAFGRGDSLYVRSAMNLTVFGPADTSQPSRSFRRNAPEIFALDRHDTLYVVSGDTVKVYAPGFAGNAAPVRTIAGPRSGVRAVAGIALDDRGWLYLAANADAGRDSSLIRVYAPGARGDVPPSRTIAGSHTRLSGVAGIALDRAGRLYVTNGPQSSGSAGAILVYAPGARGVDMPVRVLVGPATRLSPPADIAFDSKGDMYVSSSSSVSVFHPQDYGNEPPIRTIAGPNTLLSGPIALAFGRADTLYALNLLGSRLLCPAGPTDVTVTAYAPGASGDVAAVRAMTVLKEGQKPQGTYRTLAVDTSGTVQVWVGGGAMVYAPGASGPVAAVRTIREPRVDRAEPAGVAIASDGTVYQTAVPVFRHVELWGPALCT